MKLTSSISIGGSLNNKKNGRTVAHAKRERKEEERRTVNRNKPRIIGIGSGVRGGSPASEARGWDGGSNRI